jgi:uncharacterized membrane protein (DUF4010 family)
VSPLPLGVIVATLGGLAIGIERQWSGHASGPNARFAGIRTFALLGGIAGVVGWLWSIDARALAIVLLAAGAALVVAAYVSASRTEIDATTEVSAIVVLAAGVLAGLGQLAFASGVIAVTTFFLVEKSQLHAFVTRLDDEELRAAARFAVMAAVVLPLLPTGPFGPWQTVRPREVWLLVLFFSGLSFGGYLARRAVGATHGYFLAGLFGGLISSTNVTFTFARTSRLEPALALPLASGAVAASTVLFARVGLATLVLHPPLARLLLWYLVPPFLLGLGVFALGQRAATADADTVVDRPTNPLQLAAALQMAVLFQAVLIAVELTRRVWGNLGVLLSGTVLGLTDVDALTFSMARAAASGLPLDVAARAIATGLMANTALKLVLAVVLGARGFRNLVAAGLSGMAIALALALVF